MKTYQVPEEIVDLFEQAQAARDCRDASISKWFGASRALKYATIAVKASNKAWCLVGELYPETVGKGATFNDHTHTVTCKDA